MLVWRPVLSEVIYWQSRVIVTMGEDPAIQCAMLPGGWLVRYREEVYGEEFSGVVFCPDPDHEWEGAFLP